MKKLLLILICLFVSFEVKSKVINLFCSLEGKGRTNLEEEWKKVKIQQKISIDENSDIGYAELRNLAHDFITDQDFRETQNVLNGLRFGWLDYNVRVKDDEILIFTNLTKDPPLEMDASNGQLMNFSQKIKISRISGLSITKHESIERIDLSSSGNGIILYWNEYSASGECKVNPEKKF